MKKKIRALGMFFLICAISLLTIFTFNFNLRHCVYAETSCTAGGMAVIDANSGRLLYSKNENAKLAMASTTKIVTALTVLDNCTDIDREINVHNDAVGIPGTSIYLKHGEKLTVKELLYGMMLPSGNDAATALAYHVGGTIEHFCELMEKKAIECGAYNSSFSNPHGLDDDQHYTTAYDLAKITARALENETFREIVTTKATRIKGSSEGAYRYLKNKNKLLNTLDGCIGVKTGYTGNAGRCLVSACERNTFRIVCVVLNCGPMFEESSSLIEQAYDNYKYTELFPGYKVIRSLPVIGGKEEAVKVFSRKGFYYPLTKDEAQKIEYKYVLPNGLKAPVNKDEVVGEVEIYLHNHLLFSEKIYTMNSIKKIGVWSNIEDIASNW